MRAGLAAGFETRLMLVELLGRIKDLSFYLCRLRRRLI